MRLAIALAYTLILPMMFFLAVGQIMGLIIAILLLSLTFILNCGDILVEAGDRRELKGAWK